MCVNETFFQGFDDFFNHNSFGIDWSFFACKVTDLCYIENTAEKVGEQVSPTQWSIFWRLMPFF